MSPTKQALCFVRYVASQIIHRLRRILKEEVKSEQQFVLAVYGNLDLTTAPLRQREPKTQLSLLSYHIEAVGP
jgi:hypothetical protein